MKAKVLLAIAVLVVCTACAPVVAAPEPTLTPTKTPVPAPTLVVDSLQEELEDKVGVCLLTPHQFLANLPTGPRVSRITIYFFVGDLAGGQAYIFPIEKSVWLPYEGFREFLNVSGEVELDQYDRVLVSVNIDGRAFYLTRTLKDCPPRAPLESL